MLKTFAMITILAIATPVAFVACDRTVSESTRTTSTPSGTSQETKKVTQDVNGNTQVTHEKETVTH
jgi:hypothetical protein